MAAGKKPQSIVVSLARQLLSRLATPLSLVGAVFFVGTLGFLIIGQGRWNLLDCAYMTSITLTTVGYGETLTGMGSGTRLFAMILMWTGMGIVLYAVSTVTAFIVETSLSQIIRERRMEKRIAALKKHFIICGLGETGLHVATELHTTKRDFVALDSNQERVEQVVKLFPEMLILFGDATDEEDLRRAGIERSAGLIVALPEDSRNMLITVLARSIHPAIRIVARCHANSLVDKFYRAGANYVVNPPFIGGMRMASEMIRPHVVSFLDQMLRGQDPSIRVDEVVVEKNSKVAGQSLSEANIHASTGLNPIALKQPGQKDFTYNPSPEERLEAGTAIIVITRPEAAQKLRQLCRRQ